MIRNYIKIAWRNLRNNKSYSVLNIGGLAVGMTVAILIGLWIYDELSFDKYHKNYSQVAQVMQNQTFNGEVETWNSQAIQLAPELRNAYGEYFKHVVTASFPSERQISFQDKKLIKTGNYFEPGIIDMLSLNMLQGSNSSLEDLNSVILSKSTSESLFGNQEVIGKVLKIDNGEPLKVTGVYEDLPQNSSFSNLQFIAPFALIKKNLPTWIDWGNSWFQTYVQIADNAEMNDVSAKIKNVKFDNTGGSDRFKPEIFLQPMSNWRLHADFENGQLAQGRIIYVWLFGIIGVFVLLLACINFMNLSTARSEKRASEIGIRKAVGSDRKQLIVQFLFESFLFVGLAFLLSIILVQLSLPFFNDLSEKNIQILWSNPIFWLLLAGFSLLTGIIAGSYPAVYLSSFQPVKVLKGTFKVGRFASIPRKVLVVVQFTVSITLIIGTLVVFEQIQFAKNRPLGYDNNNLIIIPIKTNKIKKQFNSFRDVLISTGAVDEIAASDVRITNTQVTNSGFFWEGKDSDLAEEFNTVRISREFGDMINWEITEGRDFSPEFSSDSTGMILNESAVKYMGLENPIGTTVRWGQDEYAMDYKIIGVVKNLITQSPYEPVKQTLFVMNYDRMAFVNLKLNSEQSTSEALSKIESVYKTYDPENIFEYSFADSEFARKFGNEERFGKLATFFAFLAVLISSLGIFGLANFVAEQRTKEIGIRKVLGASVYKLWKLLSSDFVILVFISLFIASPIAYYLMTDWVQGFEYHTAISWWIFAVSGAGALLLTLLTVSYQAIKAAMLDPVKSLKSE